jgi:nicotinic acid mononucleotide adenylyltransferase/nicotinamide mononucleotide (NMN) deamidase PncC
MNTLDFQRINKALIAAGRPLVMNITGGGTEAVSALLNNGGASAYMQETLINYSPESTHQIIGYQPAHYATEEVACALAMKAFERAKALTNNPDAIGLGATAKLHKSGERNGRKHEIHVAVQTQHVTIVHSAKPNLNRWFEENIARDIILSALDSIVADSSQPFFGITNEHVDVATHIESYPLFNTSGYSVTDFDKVDISVGPSSYIFPGSFNPAHKQHSEIARAVYMMKGRKPWFEISIHNTDKPMINAIDLRKRMNALFEVHYARGVVVTDKPMFVDKAKQYGNPTFVVGTDTINRVFDPKYYYDAAQFLERKELKFLVFPRKGYQLRPELLNNPNIEFISEKDYVDDGTSSTQIRNKA